MRLVADLHVHSRYSRATSREADLEGYFRWARLKGINVVGTGDFTHPRWMEEIAEKLAEKDGLFALKEPPRDFPLEDAQPADAPVRFILTVEISSIYKKRGETRKVHSLVVCGPSRKPGSSPRGWRPSATSPLTEDPSSGWTPRTCCPSSWKLLRKGFSSRPISGRPGFPSLVPSRDSIPSRNASRISPPTSSRWRPASPPILP